MTFSKNENQTTYTRKPVNYYAVCDTNSNSVIHIGTREACERFVRERECEDHTQIWHVHDMEIQSPRPIYLYNQE